MTPDTDDWYSGQTQYRGTKAGYKMMIDEAHRVGIKVPTGCRSGLCRACVTPKISGATQKDGAKPLERITVCDSVACSDIELDL
jgi:ferredoxin